jgi:hypothetical protein
MEAGEMAKRRTGGSASAIAEKQPSRREQSRLNRLKAVAYHEAGHAVAALEFGHRFASVSITPTRESLGCVQFKPPPSWFMPNGEIDDDHCMFIDQEVLISLAGDAAWLRFKGRRNRIGSRSDNCSALDIASFLFHGKVLQAYMAYMW